MLRKHLLALNAPKVRLKTLSPAGLGHAFCEYVTRYPADSLPQAGGVDATLVVEMTLDTLLKNAPATLETGQQITAGYARKLACEAGLVPMVLAGKSQVIDAGHESRCFLKGQHRALNIRDKTCTAHGCDWPAWLCQAHHDLPWTLGGKTDLANGRLLCPRHHSYAHNPKYEMTKTKHGKSPSPADRPWSPVEQARNEPRRDHDTRTARRGFETALARLLNHRRPHPDFKVSTRSLLRTSCSTTTRRASSTPARRPPLKARQRRDTDRTWSVTPGDSPPTT
jgi:hypothetical protein